MDDEAAVLVHVVPVRDAGTVMSVVGCSNGVDDETAGAHYSVQIGDESLELGRRERHAEEHVRIRRVDAGVREREVLPDVVESDGHPIGKPGCIRFGPDRIETLARVVEGVYVEPAVGEIDRVASLTRAQLEHGRGTRINEHVAGGDGSLAGLVAVHLGMGGEGRRPVLALLVLCRRHNDSVIPIPREVSRTPSVD